MGSFSSVFQVYLLKLLGVLSQGSKCHPFYHHSGPGTLMQKKHMTTIYYSYLCILFLYTPFFPVFLHFPVSNLMIFTYLNHLPLEFLFSSLLQHLLHTLLYGRCLQMPPFIDLSHLCYYQLIRLRTGFFLGWFPTGTVGQRTP